MLAYNSYSVLSVNEVETAHRDNSGLCIIVHIRDAEVALKLKRCEAARVLLSELK